MIQFLFIDLDDTILDFHKEEQIALSKTLRAMGLEPNSEVLALYSRINKSYWERLERKELTREELLVGRFETLFAQCAMTVDPVACARLYERNLASNPCFLPGAREALEGLSKKYKLYLASNGTSRVQAGRIKSADIAHYFQDIFVSQDMGADKPDLLYFQRCFARIPGFDPAQAMMAGDSLTSDMVGAKGAGMRSCWVNADGKPHPENIVPDYQIQSLSQLEDLLETIHT